MTCQLRKELDDYFARLDPITMSEITDQGEWKVEFFYTKEGSAWEHLKSREYFVCIFM